MLHQEREGRPPLLPLSCDRRERPALGRFSRAGSGGWPVRGLAVTDAISALF